MNRIYFKTSMEELPKNCTECTCYNCNLPMKHTKSGFTDEIKKAYTIKRHPNCPLIALPDIKILNLDEKITVSTFNPDTIKK